MNTSTDSVNPICPNKPKIPYMATKTFCKTEENSSYLNWQDQSSDKIIQPQSSFAQLTGEKDIDGHCCEKMGELARASQKRLQEQVVTMSQLNILINEHSKLLQKSCKQIEDENEKKKQRQANSLDISKELSNKDKLIESWQNKFEKEKKQNDQRDIKIQNLKDKLAEVEEQFNQSQVTLSLQDQVNTWKKKFLDLEKDNTHTQQKLHQLEKELSEIKKKQPIQDESSVTITQTTVTKIVKKQE